MTETARREHSDLQQTSFILAAHVAEIATDAIPDRALVAARRSLLDAIGVSVAASGLEPACLPFRDLARDQGAGPCILLGWGDRVSLAASVLANGALAHAIDFEDVFDRSPIHPNACAVAAALAIAQARGDVSGRELLAAIAVGSDLVCRLALALDADPSAQGWYTPSILGAYGATAAAARLYGLDAAQTVDAFALTLSQVTCSTEFKRSPRSALRAIRDSFAASAAVLAAQLAARGVAGFDQPFEGEAGLYALYAGGTFDAAALLGDLGDVFCGEQISYKIWPACRGTHAFIEAALLLAREPGFALDDIASIEAEGAAFLTFLAEPKARKARPAAAIDAKFSIPFNVAFALSYGAPGIDSYSSDKLSDPAVLAFSELVDFQPVPGGFRNACAGKLTIRLRDGRLLVSEIDFAYGNPANPLGDDQLVSKFRACVAFGARSLSPHAVDRFLAALDALLEDRSSGGSTLLDTLYSE
jgi:2-methylcitrate dehydratase PrpD